MWVLPSMHIASSGSLGSHLPPCSNVDPVFFSQVQPVVSTMPQASEHRLGRTREPPLNIQPRVGSKLPFASRARSKERRNPAPGPNPMLRPLPPRPGPPEERLKKLELGRGRTSGPRPSGPLRADHGVPLPGSPPPTVALPLPSRTNLARSKSVSSGDLRPMGIALGGHRGTGELGAALSRLALRPEPPPLRRSTSLRRLGGFPGPPTLFSIRTEPPTPHGSFHVISARPSEPFYSDDKMVRIRQHTWPSMPMFLRASSFLAIIWLSFLLFPQIPFSPLHFSSVDSLLPYLSTLEPHRPFLGLSVSPQHGLPFHSPRN